jgi:Mn2+/Fe2+ NRAMP family transporter
MTSATSDRINNQKPAELMTAKKKSLLALIGPGILVAATGVGAGDLATAAFTGSRLGIAVLWAVVVGALLKFLITEGLTRWQLATGSTLLEGCVEQFGRPFRWLFLVYFLVWSFLVAAALMSACGATAHAICPVLSPEADKVAYGIIHSLLAVILVSLGGYRLFEKVMTACIGVMFLIVAATALALQPAMRDVLRGLFVPSIPQLQDGGLEWTIALLGGVGGTLTVLAYGYWIREEGRQGTDDMRLCRIDLATGYIMTALFGMAMLVIGSRLAGVEGKGTGLLVDIANGLEQTFGEYGLIAKWAFLVGAWGAVFSSLLGVWQSLPYLFTDFWNMRLPSHLARRRQVDTKSLAYRGYLYALATVPVLGLVFVSFRNAQKIYAIVGALVIPALSAVLLYLNNRTSLVGSRYRNSWKSNAILVLALLLFAYAGWLGIRAKL